MVKLLRESGWAHTLPLVSQKNPLPSGSSLLYTTQAEQKREKSVGTPICLDTLLGDLG